MPRPANGKIDKKKLPKVENVPEQREYEAPANETEEFFCRLFAEVLGVDGIGATDDFFACGGTSLSATSVMIRATEEKLSADLRRRIQIQNAPCACGSVFQNRRRQRTDICRHV
jgi:Phosphopantetheine attachment site.